MNEMKPCPFCGGEARINLFTRTGVWLIHCLNCKAIFSKGVNDAGKKATINAWNRRAEP